MMFMSIEMIGDQDFDMSAATVVDVVTYRYSRR
jgi:hypothetical protein